MENGGEKAFSCKYKVIISWSQYEEYDCSTHNENNGDYYEYPCLTHFIDKH